MLFLPFFNLLNFITHEKNKLFHHCFFSNGSHVLPAFKGAESSCKTNAGNL